VSISYVKDKSISNLDEDDASFYGPPTSCFDLGKLGYTLNGYYLIKGQGPSNKTRIVTVYCDFRQSQAGEMSSPGERIIQISNQNSNDEFTAGH